MVRIINACLSNKYVFSLFVAFILTIIHPNIWAQEYKIAAIVNDETGHPIDYFNALVRSHVDSSAVKGGAFIEGRLVISVLGNQSYILEISGLGYKKKYLPINNLKDNLDLGNIVLNTQELKEVLIKGTKPIFKIEKDKFIINIENSYLSNVGSSMDVLRYTPMIIVDSRDNLLVAGKENALIYINDKKVASKQELQSLKSSDIKKIEVITNPSAKYEASGQAILNITTINPITNGLFSSIEFQSTTAKRQSFFLSPKIGYKGKKLTIVLDYLLSKNKYESAENTIRRNHLLNTSTDERGITKAELLNHDYSISMDYYPNKKNIVGFQYKGWNNSGTSNLKNIDNYSMEVTDGISTVNTSETPHEIYNSCNFNYQITLDTVGQKVSFLLDYTDFAKKKNAYVNENDNGDYTQNRLDEHLDYQIYSMKSDYTLPLSSFSSVIELGTKYSSAINNSSTMFERNVNNVWVLDNSFENSYDFKENISAAYLTFSKDYRSLKFNTGIRFEHTLFNGKTNNLTFLDTTYLNYFPSVSVSNKFSKNSSISISYSRRIKRPSYYSLSPYIYYVDKFSYRQGNPTLKPTISDIIEVSFLYKKLTGNVGYSYVKNATVFLYETALENPSVTKIILANHKKVEFYYLNVAHNFSGKKYSMNNSLGIKIPKANISYINGNVNLYKPLLYFKHSAKLSLPLDFLLFADFSYINYGHVLLEEKKPLYNLSLGFNKLFFKKKIVLNVVANDILDTYNWKDIRKINDYEIIHEYIPDDTYLRISLRYNFGISKTFFKSKSGNNEETNRL
jgi:hypothetical protein